MDNYQQLKGAPPTAETVIVELTSETTTIQLETHDVNFFLDIICLLAPTYS